MTLLRAMLVRTMRLLWNLLSFLFIYMSCCAFLVWRAGDFLNGWTLGLAERAGQRADHWDDKLQKERRP